jgi:predicted HTH domain antitoxin
MVWPQLFLILGIAGVRKALATALFKDGDLSLSRSAKLADMLLTDFIAHISRLGIPVIKQTAEEVQEDMDTLEQWLKEA